MDDNDQYPSLNTITLSHIFLDTNVFIDAFKNPESFHEIFVFLKKKDNVIFTINSVAIEFLRGSRSVEEFQEKKEFMLSIMNSEIFTLTKQSEDLALELTLVYQSPGSSTAVTDFYLASMLGQFKHLKSTYLMTKNHKDFPTSIYDRCVLINIENTHDIQTFGFYRFNEYKYEQSLKKILKSQHL